MKTYKKFKLNLPVQIYGTSMFQSGLSEGKIGGIVEGNFAKPFVDQGDPEWENTKVKSTSKQKKMMQDPWCFYATATNGSLDAYIQPHMISKWTWGGDDGGDIEWNFGLGKHATNPEGFNKKWMKAFHNPPIADKKNRASIIKAMANQKEYISTIARKHMGKMRIEYHGTGPNLNSLIKSMKDLYNHEKQDDQPALKDVSDHIVGKGRQHVQDHVNPKGIAPAKYPG